MQYELDGKTIQVEAGEWANVDQEYSMNGTSGTFKLRRYAGNRYSLEWMNARPGASVTNNFVIVSEGLDVVHDLAQELLDVVEQAISSEIQKNKDRPGWEPTE